jgi:hypothetical protein
MTGFIYADIVNDFSRLRRLHQLEALMEVRVAPSALAFAGIISDCAAHG